MKTVLVVDDDPDFVDMVNDVLSAEGYVVVSCLDPRSASTIAGRTHPDVIIVDLLMPGESGWQVVEKLRDDPGTATVRIIVCTGAVPQVTQHLARLRQWSCDVLLKPFELNDLFDLVDRATRKDEAC